MRLSTTEVSNLDELRPLIAAHGDGLNHYSVAVEALIFNGSGQWILMHRGGGSRDEVDKLEGIGGRFENDADFRTALLREIREEVGTEADIRIIQFVEVKKDTVLTDVAGQLMSNDWVVVSFLCKHIGGKLIIAEPHKNLGFVYVNDLDVDPARLSSSAQKSLSSLRERWTHFKKVLAEFRA